MAKTEERVREVRHQIWKRRIRKIKIASFFLGLLVLLLLTLNIRKILRAIFWDMEIFKVKEVKVVPENARPVLSQVIALENPENLLFLDVDAWNKKVSGIHEVEKCFIIKEFPSTLRIEVILRKPWVFIERNWGGIYIDREGKIIEAPQNTPYFVKASGINTERNSVAEEDLWKIDALQEIEKWYNYYNLQQDFTLEQVTIVKPTEIILSDKENKRIFLIYDNLKEQFENLKNIIEKCKKDGKEWEYIDVRFKNIPVGIKKPNE